MEIIDNFLDVDDVKSVFKYCFTSSYTYGETDDPKLNHPPTGMIHNINSDESIYNLFESKIRDACDSVKGMDLYRMYVNCFAPSENPYFHIDGDGLTFLYYLTNHEWRADDGGETQFLIDDDTIKGVLPISNRLVGFDGNIWHRATPFRYNHRFTLAAKFRK